MPHTFPNSENPQCERWRYPIEAMLTRLGADLNNHRKLADPWQRKAQSMVKAWTLRLNHAPPPRRPTVRPAPADWKEAATAMVRSLDGRARQQRTHTGWKRWATGRAYQDRRWPGRFHHAMPTRTQSQPSAGDVSAVVTRPQ